MTEINNIDSTSIKEPVQVSEMTENQETERKTKNKFIHPIKGPLQLQPQQIADIVTNRGVPGSRKMLAAKYGISEARISKIWKEYYGGGKKSNFKTGLKKQLPSELNINDPNIRKIKTERGVYITKEPKTEIVNMKAKPVRKINPVKQLDLNNIEGLTEEQARIISGEIQAGNNSQDLLKAINRLVESNQSLSRKAIKSLQQAKHYYKNNYESSNIDTDYDETVYESGTNSEYETDDSTIAYKQNKQGKRDSGCTKRIQKNSTGIRNELERRKELGGIPEYPEYDDEEYYEGYNEYSPASILRPDAIRYGTRNDANTEGLRIRSPGYGTRAQPVYRTGTDTRTLSREIYESPLQTIGYQQAIPSTQYDTSKTSIQPNNPNNNTEQYQKSGQFAEIPSGSRNRSGDTEQIFHNEAADPRIPWLKRRNG